MTPAKYGSTCGINQDGLCQYVARSGGDKTDWLISGEMAAQTMMISRAASAQANSAFKRVQKAFGDSFGSIKQTYSDVDPSLGSSESQSSYTHVQQVHALHIWWLSRNLQQETPYARYHTFSEQDDKRHEL